VTVAYVESRLFMAEASADPNATNDWDDPLEDEVLRAEQLEVLSNLGRCRTFGLKKGKHRSFKKPPFAMATMNFHAELLNGRRIAIPIPLDMTIRELKEELKDFQGSADEKIRKLCAVDILIDGEALNDLDAIVSKILPTFRANVQVAFRIPPPPILCSMKELAGCNVEDLRYVGVPYPEREIPPHGFAGCHALFLVDIADSVTRLGPSAFAGCSSLRSLAIPDTVTEIGQGTFDGCSSLADLSIPRGLRSIGRRTFIGCTSLTKLAIPPSVTEIGESAFAGCSSLRSLNLPESVMSIGRNAFAGCRSLSSLDIPNGVTEIWDGTFDGCGSLMTLSIPASVTQIGQGAFVGCSSLTSLTIPESVTCIKDGAFDGCSSLRSLTFLPGLLSMGKYAFAGCSSLTRLDIPNSVTEIGDGAFDGCSSLTSLTIPETVRLGQQNLIPQQVFEKKMTSVARLHDGCAGGWPCISQGAVSRGELAGRIFRLVNLTVGVAQKFASSAKANLRGIRDCVPRLDLGTLVTPADLQYLYFLEQFRKLYIGEHAKQVVQQQVNERLATVLGLEDENAVLGLLINKIGNNLQQRYQIESVVKKTLALFHELAAGINIVHTSDRSPHLIVCGRLLLKNEMVKYILSNHASPEFGFLTYSLQYGKYRTMYYHTLGKLLFMDIRDNKEAFEKFMEPQGLILTQLWQQSCQNPQLLRQDHVKPALIGLCRDLRGIGLACTSCEPYSMLFDWLVDNPKNPSINRVNLFSRALDAWWDDPEVTTPLLKFMAEFVHNKAQRITFDQSSPNGILLFREASAILVTYGTRILQRTQFRDVYVEKYKGIGVCLDMFSHALHGNYTNFGVFELYSDNSLSNSMALALRMCLAIPLQELNAYLKALKPYYYFVELATRGHMPKVMELDSGTFSQLMQSVEEGLLSFETGVQMQSCAVVDNVISYFHSQLTGKSTPEQDRVRRFLQEAPQCLQKILHLMFQLVMTGEFSSMWSISRPLLGLILLHDQHYLQLKEQLINQQIEEKRAKLRSYFDDLMTGVENSMNTKNKDHFTRNLYNFAQVVRTLS
ncbi:unnamed protein product, partial [Cladocopium goreaui]